MSERIAVLLHEEDLENPKISIELLFRLGHFLSDDFPDLSESTLDRLLSSCRYGDDRYVQACLSYQSFSSIGDGGPREPLVVDGVFGRKTMRSARERFCSCPDILPLGGSNYWGHHDLTYRHTLSTLSPHDEDSVLAEAFGYWEEGTVLTFKEWQSGDHGPNISARVARIDGPGGVLADAWLPPANASRNWTSNQRYDVSDNQTREQLLGVSGHEIGHSCGAPHIRNQGSELALMNPYYQRGVTRPQRLDLAFMDETYGKPTGPTDPPTPSDDEVYVDSEHSLPDGRTLLQLTVITSKPNGRP